MLLVDESFWEIWGDGFSEQCFKLRSRKEGRKAARLEKKQRKHNSHIRHQGQGNPAPPSVKTTKNGNRGKRAEQDAAHPKPGNKRKHTDTEYNEDTGGDVSCFEGQVNSQHRCCMI